LVDFEILYIIQFLISYLLEPASIIKSMIYIGLPA